MKKYSTTLLNGFILGISTMLFIGAKSQDKNFEDKNFGNIVVRAIGIVDKNNEIKAEISSNDEFTYIKLQSPLGGTTIVGGSIGMNNPEGKIASYMGVSTEAEGIVQVYNKKGNVSAYMGTSKGTGLITTSNSKGNQVTYMGSDSKNEDGLIKLYDRYGDAGWSKTGKR